MEAETRDVYAMVCLSVASLLIGNRPICVERSLEILTHAKFYNTTNHINKDFLCIRHRVENVPSAWLVGPLPLTNQCDRE